MAFGFNKCKLSDGTEIKGLYEIQPKIFGDAREYFLETYSERDFFAVDLRKGSPSFGKYYGVILDAEKQNMFYIQEGFAHGFYVLSDEGIFTYKCTDFYDPKGEGASCGTTLPLELTGKLRPQI